MCFGHNLLIQTMALARAMSGHMLIGGRAGSTGGKFRKGRGGQCQQAVKGIEATVTEHEQGWSHAPMEGRVRGGDVDVEGLVCCGNSLRVWMKGLGQHVGEMSLLQPN